MTSSYAFRAQFACSNCGHDQSTATNIKKDTIEIECCPGCGAADVDFERCGGWEDVL